MDKGTKIILVIASIGLLLMLIALGHDLFFKSSSSSSKAQASIVQMQATEKF